MGSSFKIIPNVTRRHNRYYFIIAGFFGLVITLILAVYIIITFGKILTINVSLERSYDRFDTYKRGLQNYPSDDREDFLMNQNKGLESILTQLREYPIFWDKIINIDIATTSPLKFKEELFRIKRTLQKRAEGSGVILSKDIGFSTWEKKLPQPSQLEDLFQALEIVREVSTIAIDSHVHEIEDIYVSEIARIPYTNIDQQQTYYERELRIRLNGKCSNLIQFLYGVHISKILLYVKDMRIYNIHASEKSEGSIHIKSSQKSASDPLDPSLIGEFTIVNTCL